MLERFTERARRVIVLATEEARSRRHEAVAPEHLLMGILRDGGSRAAKELEWLRVRAEVERVLNETPGSATSGEPAFSPELKTTLEAALELLRRHPGSIGPEHLLLGLLADDGSAASRILRAAGADLDAARRWARLFAGLFIATSKWRVQI